MTKYPERTWDFDRQYQVEGPWSTEPDKVQWVDETTDLDCLMVRNRGGVWCGYVGVTKDHPWFGIEYSRCPQDCQQKAEKGYCNHEPEAQIEVHGSLTFSDKCHEGAGDEAVCHVPYPGRDGHVWWFGFDTAHAFDLMPAYFEVESALNKSTGFLTDPEHNTYRDIDYVRREVGLLASQLAKVKP